MYVYVYINAQLTDYRWRVGILTFVENVLLQTGDAIPACLEQCKDG